MPNILLIDDDRELTLMLSQYLKAEGFNVSAAHDGSSGESEALSGAFDLIVLDVMLPRVTGIDLLRRIRRKSDIPVLLLTARGADVDRIAGLDLGADDYVPKPCSPGELVARMRAILRRVPGDPAVQARETIEAGPLVMWPGSRRAHWHDEVLALTSTEFSLLEVLARHGGQIVAKEQLSLDGLGRALTPYDRRIDVHISSIRQKLGPRPDGESWIIGVRGQGYQLATA
ncbi:DNA-binding response regulator [Novosphingobium sp. PC22D]|uniref:response regulator transcription factor n=1 Tax=Novosphingobium sp. PC22D TaxID=1962403 RepID=UPI000BF1E195|nr:response regulator transcription factor [Novosphingobium sp. PC22D]PEQ10518.1 DNA-binding response regulator [Novosphingobium sp. PC22D]